MMMDWGNLDFVVAPPEDRFCPVCTELLTEPFLSDCGHHVCRECHKRIMATSKTMCPTCQEPNALKTARLNKHLQREIYYLKVHCQNKIGSKRGCQWIGELRELEDHLNPAKKSCKYIPLVCPFGCGEQVPSGDMKDHKEYQCPKRQEKCKHCDYHNSHDIVMENHLPVCPEFLVECPNKCTEENLKRKQLKPHIDECPLQVIECPFSSAGCTVKLPRNQMVEHEDTAMRQHLRIVAKQLNSLQESSAPCTVATTVVCPQHIYNIPPVDFIMTGFLEKKQADKVWTSPPYYTHIGGYKFCLEVYPNGDGSGKGTHISVFTHLMEGEHDDELEWPFEGWITFELVNQKKDDDHYQSIFVFNGQTNTVGFTEFISHADLSYSPTTNTEYLQDDCLQLRVGTLARIVSVSKFTEFSERKQSFMTYNSQPFYTHPQGYKMCLQVKANGSGKSLGTHMSVYATLMIGEHDQHLQWPFTGEFIIDVLNWREDKGHHSMRFLIISDSGFVRVTGRQKYGQSRGYHQFISHSSLPYNPTTNTEYLRDDCLRLRVSVTKINC